MCAPRLSRGDYTDEKQQRLQTISRLNGKILCIGISRELARKFAEVLFCFKQFLPRMA